jgi:hypothetical protein
VNVDFSCERPYRRLLVDSLAHVRPSIRDPGKRRAFARLAHFLMRSLSPDEGIIADVLDVATASTDSAVVVRYLLSGVWAVVDDNMRLLEWFTKVADRALRREHLAGFCAALQLLVHLPGFGPVLSDSWLDGIRRARQSDDGETLREAFWFGVDYEFKLHPSADPPLPEWLIELRQDPRVLDAAKEVIGDRCILTCPLCGKAFTP